MTLCTKCGDSTLKFGIDVKYLTQELSDNNNAILPFKEKISVIWLCCLGDLKIFLTLRDQYYKDTLSIALQLTLTNLRLTEPIFVTQLTKGGTP